MCQYLIYNKTVTNVDLAVNRISTRGARALAFVLRTHKALQSLDLSDNEISDAGAVSLIAALNHNVSVTRLNISGNVPGIKVTPRSMATIKYLTQVRNAKIIPAAVRSAALFLVGIRSSRKTEGMGVLAFFPKEIVLMIAVEVWATRLDPKWIDVLIGPDI